MRALLLGLIDGSVDVSEAADRAMDRVKDEPAAYASDRKLWSALDRLAGADLQRGPGECLHGVADFRDWLADFDA